MIHWLFLVLAGGMLAGCLLTILLAKASGLLPPPVVEPHGVAPPAQVAEEEPPSTGPNPDGPRAEPPSSKQRVEPLHVTRERTVRIEATIRAGVRPHPPGPRGACGIAGCPNMRPHSHVLDLARRLGSR